MWLFAITLFSAYMCELVKEFDLYQVPLARILTNSQSKNDLPIALTNENDYILYDMRLSTMINQITIELHDFDCKELKSINIFLSNTTLKNEGESIGTKHCRNLKSDKGKKIVFNDVGYSRFVRLEFFSEPNRGNPATITKINFLTKQYLITKMGKVNFIKKLKGDKMYYFFPTKTIAKIEIDVPENFDFEDSSKFPLTEVLLDLRKEISPFYAKMKMKVDPLNHRFSAIFPNGFSAHALRIKNYNDVRIEFYSPGDYVLLGKTVTGSFTTENENRILRVEFPMIKKNESITGFLFYKIGNKSNEFPVYAKSNYIDVNFVANKIRFVSLSNTTKHMNLFVSPCNHITCHNMGICMIRQDIKKGYGCNCPREYIGEFCETPEQTYCADLSTPKVVFGRENYNEEETVTYRCIDPKMKAYTGLTCRKQGLFNHTSQMYIEVNNLC